MYSYTVLQRNCLLLVFQTGRLCALNLFVAQFYTLIRRISIYQESICSMFRILSSLCLVFKTFSRHSLITSPISYRCCPVCRFFAVCVTISVFYHFTDMLCCGCVPEFHRDPRVHTRRGQLQMYCDGTVYALLLHGTVYMDGHSGTP